MRRVYLETTVISYLTARPSRTVVGAAHQQLTIDWWDQRRQDFDLVVSELVLREAEAGDPEAAKRRLAVLAGIPRLSLTDDAVSLAKLAEFLEERGLFLPFICTPEELLGGEP